MGFGRFRCLFVFILYLGRVWDRERRKLKGEEGKGRRRGLGGGLIFILICGFFVFGKCLGKCVAEKERCGVCGVLVWGVCGVCWRGVCVRSVMSFWSRGW